MPCLEQFRFLFARDAGTQFRLALRRQAMEPRKQVGHGRRERTEAESGRDRTRVADLSIARVWAALRRYPDRQLDFLFFQEPWFDMSEFHRSARNGLATMQHRVHRHRVVRAAGVERAEGARFRQPDHPFGEVAAVDDLHRIRTIARHQHFAALRNTVRPVGEAVGLVARPDDVARTHDRHAFAELLVRFGLAQCLERAVQVFDIGTQRLLRLGHRVLALVRRERGILVDAGLAAVGIDRNRGNEEVMPDVALQHLAGIAHPDRQAGGIVDAHVPLAAFQRLQVAIAIAEQLFNFARPFRRRPLAAIEQGDLVAARQRVVHLERTGEPGATEDQDAQRFFRTANGRGCRGRGHRRQRGRGGGERAELEQFTTGGHAMAPGWRMSRQVPSPSTGPHGWRNSYTLCRAAAYGESPARGDGGFAIGNPENLAGSLGKRRRRTSCGLRARQGKQTPHTRRILRRRDVPAPLRHQALHAKSAPDIWCNALR